MHKPEIKNPIVRRKLDSELDQLAAAQLYDQGALAMEEGIEARSELPAIKASMKALELVVTRPVVLNATLKAPAAPRGGQNSIDYTKCLVAATVAEFMRRAAKIEVSETIEKLLPTEKNVLQRKVANGILKSAQSPSNTHTPGAGEELTQHATLGFWRGQKDVSVLGELVDRGLATVLEFGSANWLSIPKRETNDSGSTKAAWIAENQTIPVVSGKVEAKMLLPYKLGAIASFSNELAKTSIENISSIVEEMILDDTAISMDEAFLSADPQITATRPAGILNGLTAVTPATTAAEDLKNLLLKMAQFKARKPVWIMSPAVHLALWMEKESGLWTWRDELTKGMLLGQSFIVSNNVGVNLIIVDGSALILALNVPEIDTTGEATLVMVNAATPAPQMGDGDTNAVSEGTSVNVSDAAGTTPPSEVRSMHQAYSTAVRIVIPQVSWALIEDAAIAFVTPSWSV